MRRLLLSLLAALSLVACTQNEVEELTANRADIPETLTVGFEGADDETRVQLQNSKTVWTKGDEVSVFYFSNANQRWQFQGETGERTGKLKRLESAEATAETTYNVVAYPYDSNYFLNPRTCALHATLPATQHYAADSYGAGGNIMVAQSEFTQFSLKNVCGWLRVELTGEGEVVKSITLRGNAGEQVAGLISVDTATAEATLASEMGEASDEEQVGGVGGGLEFDNTVFTEVTLDCGDGVELGAEATAFYIALLPQTFEKGMTVEINYANGNYQTLVCESSITISRNHISPIESEANEEADVPTNQLWYTATALVEPYDTSAFNVAIVSNEWDEATGEGIITFDGKLTSIGDYAFWGCDDLTSVTIGDSVTTIRVGAFSRCSSLTSVTIGDSVTTIGDWAFGYCESLTSVTIPDSVTTIGDSAFSGCHSLTSVTIPDSVTTIGDFAFRDCDSLTSVTIGNSVTTIGDGVFADCYRLAEFKGKFAADGGRCLIKDNTLIAYANASGTTYTIPDSVTSIGEDAFSYCYSLTSVVIPDSVTSIGTYAFYDCDSLTSVTIGNSVMTIGKAAFASCSSLAEFKGKFAVDEGRCLIVDGVLNAFAIGCGAAEYTIPDSVTAIGDSAFSSCRSLESVTIPDSVTSIGDSAFFYCDSLTSVTIGDSVTTIGVSAFMYCESLTSVTIGDSVTTIGDRAFMYCYSLTSVTIPDSVTTIGRNAFENCGLTSVYCKATTPPSLDDYVFKYYVNGYVNIGCAIYVPAESVEEYKAATNWSEYASYIVGYDFETGEEVAISNKLFYTATALVEPYNASAFNAAIVSNEWDEATDEGVITFDGELTTIGAGAFLGCSSLTSVTIPDSVTTIGAAAFYDCIGLTSVIIPDSVTTIDNQVFYNCVSLKDVTLGNNVASLGYSLFWGCCSLESIVIPDSVVSIETWLFVDCSNLSEFNGKFATEDGRCLVVNGELCAFAPAGIKDYTIPDSVTTIGTSAFRYCSSLTSVTIPDSVTTIGSYAFLGCDSLAEFKGKFAADGGRCLIKDNTIIAYAEASGTTYTIPDSVTTIGDAVFCYCANLTSITIPNTVTKIGESAFRECNNLVNMFIPDSVCDIGGRAFCDCYNLTSIEIPNSVITLGDEVFAFCRNISNITIGNNVSTIGRHAFYGCYNLKSIIIPESVNLIDDRVFRACFNLTSVYCKAIEPPTAGNSLNLSSWSAFQEVPEGYKIYVPAESVEAYKAADGWSEYAADIVGYDFETGEVVE